MYKVPEEDEAGEREALDRGKETIYYKIKVIDQSYSLIYCVVFCVSSSVLGYTLHKQPLEGCYPCTYMCHSLWTLTV